MFRTEEIPMDSKRPCRRSLALGSLGALLVVPLAASAQPPAVPTVGVPADQVLDRYRDLIEQETLAFTIAQAVEVATLLHPEVRRLNEQLAETPVLRRAAMAPYLPQLDLDLQAAQTRDPGFRNSPFFSRLIEDPDAAAGFGGGDPSEFGGAFTFGTYMWNLSLSQTLWSFRLPPARRGVALQEALIQADIEEAQNRIARDTATRLYAYLLGLRTREVLARAVETRERGLSLARDRLDLGADSRLAVLRARVDLSRLRRQLADAEDALALERAGINALVGRDQNKEIEVLDELVLPEPLPRVFPAAALMELAGQERPALRRFGLDREVLAAEMSLAAADSRPEVRANASWGINTFTFENTYDLELHNWNAGVSLDWTLFDGLGSRSRIASLRSRQTQNEWEQNEYESTLEVLLRDATRDWQAALNAIEEATLAIEEAAEAERVAREELAAGVATPFLVLDTEQARREVALERTTHTRDALAALAELKFLVGHPANAPHSVIADTTPLAAAPSPESDQEERR